MARSVILCSSPWVDLSLEELAQKASEWGYQGLELCCGSDHFQVQRALSEPDYCQNLMDLLARYDLTVPVLGCHRVSQAVCDRVDQRHQGLLPDYVWGDGNPQEVSQRAAEEMLATVQAAQKMGISTLVGFTGSALGTVAAGFPPPTPDMVAGAFRDLAARWNPILDLCRDCGLRFALEVQPGQLAFDLYTAEVVLEVLAGREEIGFAIDPSQLHWQGVDPVEFLRRFPERIYHVHIKDVALTLNGRSSILNSFLPPGDPRRGWDFRSPGHGGIDWESLIRALNDIGYAGPLSVDWQDSGMKREAGAEDACKFVKRLDFESARSGGNPAFRD